MLRLTLDNAIRFQMLEIELMLCVIFQKCTEWPVEKCEIRKEVVTKVTPETKCEKVPKEKCAPDGCGFVPGVQECFDKVETVVQEVS